MSSWRRRRVHRRRAARRRAVERRWQAAVLYFQAWGIRFQVEPLVRFAGRRKPMREEAQGTDEETR